MLKPLTKTDYRQLFCAALRSGKYEQVHGEDWYNNKVCALGVGVREKLFDTFDDLDGEEMARRLTQQRADRVKEKTPFDFYEDAQMKLGLTPKQVERIYGMNDGGKTFEEIADWIEAQP